MSAYTPLSDPSPRPPEKDRSIGTYERFFASRTLPKLHTAAGTDTTGIKVKDLLDEVDVDLRRRAGSAPTSSAELPESLEELRLGHVNGTLLKKMYPSPLHLACDRGLLKTVNVLCFAGADTNAKDDPVRGALTPMHCAARSTSLMDPAAAQLMAILLSFKGCANARDGMGSTPLVIASALGRVGVMQVLLSAEPMAVVGACAGATQTTSLHAACRGGHTAAVALLLDHGAKATAFDRCGCHPAQLAQASGFPKITETVLAARRLQVNGGKRLLSYEKQYQAYLKRMATRRLDLDSWNTELAKWAEDRRVAEKEDRAHFKAAIERADGGIVEKPASAGGHDYSVFEEKTCGEYVREAIEAHLHEQGVAAGGKLMYGLTRGVHKNSMRKGRHAASERDAARSRAAVSSREYGTL